METYSVCQMEKKDVTYIESGNPGIRNSENYARYSNTSIAAEQVTWWLIVSL